MSKLKNVDFTYDENLSPYDNKRKLRAAKIAAEKPAKKEASDAPKSTVIKSKKKVSKKMKASE